MNLSAFGHSFGNAYSNVTNVILKITPVGAGGVPGVLVNSHYDSGLGSVGASDAAGCVGVILELGRLAIADGEVALPAPLVLLMNGAEETLMQGAHGFARRSPHAAGLGAFVNLESTGNWGPDVLFQSTQDWTLPAYARVAPHPRGNTIFQNFFDLGLIPADTDYRLLAYRRAGSLPGIDVAQVFDGLAYHTNQDVPERIRPGTLQVMGGPGLVSGEWGLLLLAPGEASGLRRNGCASGHVWGGCAGELVAAMQGPSSLPSPLDQRSKSKQKSPWPLSKRR